MAPSGKAKTKKKRKKHVAGFHSLLILLFDGRAHGLWDSIFIPHRIASHRPGSHRAARPTPVLDLNGSLWSVRGQF